MGGRHSQHKHKHGKQETGISLFLHILQCNIDFVFGNTICLSVCPLLGYVDETWFQQLYWVIGYVDSDYDIVNNM